MSQESFERAPGLPPEITFMSLPKPLAQFHHLPSHAPLWIHQQEEMGKKGYDFQSGVGAMEELLRQAPGAPGAYLYQLFVKKWPKLVEVNPYFESHRFAEAIPKLVEILDIDPECPLTCFQLGYCFRVTGELEKSESFYKQALRMAPEAGWIQSNLGRTYLAMGEKAKAAEAFWKALELLPGDHFVLEQLMGLGELFLLPSQDQEKKDTATFIRRAEYEKKMGEIVARESDAEALVKLGWGLFQNRVLQLSCRSFEKALTARKDLAEAVLGLGTAHLEAGNFKEAEKHLTGYLDKNPQSVTAHLNLYRVYWALEEQDLAWDEIQRAVELDPGRLDVLRQLYSLYRETDRKDEGLEWLDRLAVDHPDSFGPPLIKAQALAEDQAWTEAEQALREALRRAPHHEEVLLFYSSELGKRGMKAELIRLLESESEPLPLSLTINLALAHSQNGEWEKGRLALQDFLKRPGLSPVDQARAKVILKEFEDHR